jgi:hypothetical protein
MARQGMGLRNPVPAPAMVHARTGSPPWATDSRCGRHRLRFDD